MNKLFTKIASAFVGIAMAVGVGVALGVNKAESVKGEDYVVNTSNCGWTTTGGEQSGTPFTGITVSTDSGAYNTSNDDFRVYKGYTMTVSSTIGDISSLSFTFSGSNNGGWSDSYTPESSSWTSPEVSGTQARVKSMTITIGGAPVQKYSVIFNANGEGVTDMPSNLTDKTGSVSLADVAHPSRSGYDFKGWSLTSDGAIVSSVTVTNADVNVYAIWEENDPSISTSSLIFAAACGGSGTADDGAVWTVDSDANESNFDSGRGIHYGTNSASVTYITLNTSDIEGTITKVVVNASDAQATATASVSVGGDAYTCTGSASVTNSNPGSDYTFTGNSSGEIVVSIARSEAQVKALYVKSIVVTYKSGEAPTGPFTVTYDANGGSGTMTDATEYESGAEVTILENTFTRSFFTISGWNTKADGSGTSYALGGKFNIASDTTLFAQWAYSETVLGNGSYNADFPFAAEYPHSIGVKNSSSQTVGLIEVQATGLSQFRTYNEYELAVDGSIVFKNHTNAPVTKVILNAYQFDNFKLSVGSNVIHTGTGAKGTGDPVVFEMDIPEAQQSTSDIKVEHYSGEGTYTQKIYSIQLFFKVGSDVVHPTSVDLNAESGNVYIGKTRQLTATVLPADADDKTVSWSSDDETVATVDENGLVEGKAAGEATITATTHDGGFTASFTATVKTLSYGTESEPLSVEEAREVLEINGSSASDQQLYVKGIVSTNFKSSSKPLAWLQSSDGTTERYFEVFNFTFDSSIKEDYSANDALKGLEIVACGYGMIYSGTTYELTPNNSVSPSILDVSHTLASFTAAILSDTKELCDAYDDETTDYETQKAALSTVWEALEKKYDTLSDSDKSDLVDIEAKKDGKPEEQAMARYDFLCVKYQFKNFITGRVPVGLGNSTTIINNNNNDTTISMVVVTVIALTSVSAIAVLLVIKRRKSI